jgi:hypothetical protein
MSMTDTVDTQGGMLRSAPLRTGPVNPQEGLYSGKGFEIDAEKLKTNRALSRQDLIGRVYTEDILVPKSVYRTLGDNYHPEFDPEYNARLLSTEQSNGGKFLSAMNQAIVGEIVGGTIEGLGYLIDLPMLFDLAEGTEQEFGNAISKFGKSIGKWAEDTTPIYTDPTAPKFNPTSFEWWMKNAPSVASTVSLVLPSMGGMAALKGIGNLLKITDTLGDMGKYSKLFSTSLGQAVMSRHMESLMESQGVYDQGLGEAKNALYNKYADQIDKEVKSLPIFTPVDPETGPQPGQYTQEQYQADLNKIKNKWENVVTQEAQKVAAVGAANTYSKNWILLLQDLPEYMLLNRFLNKGKASIAKDAEKNSAEVAKFLGMNMPAFYASKTAKHVANMGGEMLEEQYQFLANEQSSEYIRNLADPDKKTSLSKELLDNYDNGEFWTNGFFGAIGAGFMQATMAGINAKALSDSGKARVKQLTELSPLLNKLHSDYVAAEEAGDLIGMEAAKQGFVAESAIKSVQMGNKEHLLNLVDALANDKQNVLTNYEIDPEARTFFKGKNDIADDIKANIESVSKRYNDAIAEGKTKGLDDKQNRAIAGSIAHSNHMLDYLNKNLKEEQDKLKSQELEGYNKPNPAGELLSDKGKQSFEVAYHKKDLQKRLKAVEKILAKEDITADDKEKYTKKKERLEAKLVLSNELLNNISKDTTVSKEQRAIDAKLHGDLTKDEPNGIIPTEGVMDFIGTQKNINSYEESVEYFKDALTQARGIADAMSTKNKNVKPEAPKVPPVEDREDLDVGHIVKYKGTDGVDGRGIVRSIEYAQKDTEGSQIEPSAENVDNIVTIQPIDAKNNPIGDLVHISGATVEKESVEAQTQAQAGEAEEDVETEEEKNVNRKKTNSTEKGLIEFLSYTEYEDQTPDTKGKLRKLLVRNQELDNFISNPENQQYLPSATANYKLDLTNADFKARMDKARKEKRIPAYLLDTLDEYISKGKKLKEEDIKKLLTYNDFFGNIAISVDLTKVGYTCTLLIRLGILLKMKLIWLYTHKCVSH